MDTEPWFEAFRIGVPMIDADHYSLFLETRKFERGARDGMTHQQMGEALDFLYRYVGSHFVREEQMMREKNYPHYVSHKSLHHQLKRVVYAVKRIYELAPERVDQDKVHEFLNHWLQEHIMQVDQKLIPCFTGAKPQDSNDAGKDFHAMRITAKAELTEVTVRVPANKRHIIERCAYVLQYATPESEDLEELATSATGMSLDEALALASVVLHTGHGQHATE
ncbi:MAG: bacteriohemerythrin [Magnetococcus sp. WYHC-3]